MANSTVYLKYDSNGLQYSLTEGGSYQAVGDNTLTGNPSAGKTITWVVVAGGGIDSIKSIDVHKAKDPDDHHKDIWANIPKKDDPKGITWTGTIKTDAVIGTWDGYDITLNTSNFGTVTIDPKVPVAPGP